MADNDHLPQNTHIPADPGPGAARMDSRRIPPHGDVSPKGDRIWPRPSMTAKVLVYGGTALAAAAATAAGVLAVRKVADLVSGNEALDREADRAAERAAERARQQVYSAARGGSSGHAPRFAIMPDPEREEMRTRARSRMREDAAARNRLREQARAASEAPGKARPPRPAPPRQGLLDEIESNARRVTRTIDDVVGAVGAAVAGFRSVAGQADGLMREFGGAADQLRSFFDRGHAGGDARKPAPGAPFRRTPDRGDGDAQDDPRVHRL